MTQQDYLDAAQRALGINSDYALAAHLGITRQAMSKLRRGVVFMSNTRAAQIARILDVPVARVIADLELERGSDPQLWKSIRSAAAWVAAALGAVLLYRVLMDAPGAFDLSVLCDACRAHADTLAFVPLMLNANTHCVSLAILATAATWQALRAVRRLEAAS